MRQPLGKLPLVRRAWPVLLALALLSGCGGDQAPAKRTLVIGIDGLDPGLLRQFVDEGVLPNFERMMAEGDFSPLQTTMPPLSPIAWSTFITGMDPGGHGIYDFIHREPELMGEPGVPIYNAMSRAVPPWAELGLGSWVVPLGGDVENLRKGPAFWQMLDEVGIPTTVFRMPANYPPVDSSGRALSGMGTPDMRGTPGTFSYYTDFPVADKDQIGGGEVYYVEVVDNHVQASLEGPENPMRRERRGSDGTGSWRHPPITTPFDVYLDPEEPVAKLVIGDQELILQEGEWSDWIPVSFDAVSAGLPFVDTDVDAVPLISVGGVGRFYLQQVRPDFQLYVTPVQIDVADPAQTISTPKSWSKDLSGEIGRFYTQELPEDTKAFTHDIFSGHEFWEQAQFVYRERRRALDHFLDDFDSGFLFFYFSSVDQGCHMLWHYLDDEHPGFEADEMLHGGVRTLYQEMDEALGRVLEAVDDDTTLIVMSDHGFNPFYWQVNLNTWLLEKGYVTLKDPSAQGRLPVYLNVDWSRTKAYAAGLNGLYLNLAGREKHGIVEPDEAEALLDELERELLAMRDTQRDDRQVVTLVTRTRRDFHGPYLDIGPDIIVGYNWGYRSGWKSPTGEFPRKVIEDNLDAWSGDHAVDYRLVPGVLLSNREITLDEPALYDLTVAILDEYGVEKHPDMIGRDCLGGPVTRGPRTDAPQD